MSLRWQWHGGFTASKREEDGTVTEKKFTSVAQARQFVEQEENMVLAERTTTAPTSARNRIPASKILTPEQKRLRQEALKIAQGL